jgi:hypothetical protein
MVAIAGPRERPRRWSLRTAGSSPMARKRATRASTMMPRTRYAARRTRTAPATVNTMRRIVRVEGGSPAPVAMRSNNHAGGIRERILNPGARLRSRGSSSARFGGVARPLATRTQFTHYRAGSLMAVGGSVSRASGREGNGARCPRIRAQTGRGGTLDSGSRR